MFSQLNGTELQLQSALADRARDNRDELLTAQAQIASVFRAVFVVMACGRYAFIL